MVKIIETGVLFRRLKLHGASMLRGYLGGVLGTLMNSMIKDVALKWCMIKKHDNSIVNPGTSVKMLF